MRAYGFAGSRVLALQMHPFKLELYEGGKLVAVANGDNKFYFEHHRSRDDNALPAAAGAAADAHGGKTVVDYGEDRPLTLTLTLTLTLALTLTWLMAILYPASLGL